MSILIDIQQCLFELRDLVSADKKQHVTMNRPLSLLDVEDAESQFGIRFPDSYRNVITQIGNGGDYHFFPLLKDQLGRWYWQGDGDGEHERCRTELSLPFPHAADANIYDHPFFSSSDWLESQEIACELGNDAEDFLWGWFDEHRWDVVESEWMNRHFQGSVDIVHYGCAMRSRLVTAGKLAGTVWHTGDSLDFDIGPSKGPDGRPMQFDEWFLSELEQDIHERRRNRETDALLIEQCYDFFQAQCVVTREILALQQTTAAKAQVRQQLQFLQQQNRQAIEQQSKLFAEFISFSCEPGYITKITVNKQIYLPAIGRILQQWHLASLRHLNLSFLSLQQLPDWLAQLQQITELSCTNNRISILPDWIGDLHNLRKLILENNILTTLPNSIGKLQQLEELTLSKNDLQQLPDAIQRLTSLQRLYLDHNQLKNIPAWIEQLGRLGYLNLEENHLSALPDAFGRLGRLSVLLLSRNDFREFPVILCQLSGLSHLHFSANKLKVIAADIGRLHQLCFLNISHNQIRTLPDAMGELLQLTDLHLSGNRIKYLPIAMGRLPRLTTLWLTGNELNQIPKSIVNLQQLTDLYLSSNNFKSIPTWLVNLRKLSNLKLSYNQLRKIPEWLDKLPELRHLDVSYNYISDVPYCLRDKVYMGKQYSETH